MSNGICRWGMSNNIKMVAFGNSCCLPGLGESYFDMFQSLCDSTVEIVTNPRQANYLLVHGAITPLTLQVILNMYEDMPQNKKVIVVGSCALNGGLLNGYNVIRDLSKYIKVDYVLHGCPVDKNTIRELMEQISQVAVKECIKE
jgi:NADH:ubiquinone oxidoreductase subunit B-like Fe-S oxidoreductase